MISFKQFLEESAPVKNLHLEHIEDEIFNLGFRGARESINFLRSLRDMLSGNSGNSVKVTVKFDGANSTFDSNDTYNTDTQGYSYKQVYLRVKLFW